MIYIEQAMHQTVFPPPRKRSEDEQKIYAAVLKQNTVVSFSLYLELKVCICFKKHML